MGHPKEPISPGFVRPFYSKTRFLLMLLVAAVIYSYAWRVTEIDPAELIRDAHLVKPLIRDLLHPDLFTPKTDSQSVEAVFFLSTSALPQQGSP